MKYVVMIAKALSILSGFLILVSAVLISYSAFARYFFSISSTWKNELSIYLLMASVWLGIGPAMLARRHVSIKLLSRFGSRKLSVLTHIFSYLASIGVGLVLLTKGVQATIQAINGDWHASTTWGPSLVGPYLVIPVGMCVFVIAAVINFLLPLAKTRSKI